MLRHGAALQSFDTGRGGNMVRRVLGQFCKPMAAPDASTRAMDSGAESIGVFPKNSEKLDCLLVPIRGFCQNRQTLISGNVYAGSDAFRELTGNRACRFKSC